MKIKTLRMMMRSIRMRWLKICIQREKKKTWKKDKKFGLIMKIFQQDLTTRRELSVYIVIFLLDLNHSMKNVILCVIIQSVLRELIVMLVRWLLIRAQKGIQFNRLNMIHKYLRISFLGYYNAWLTSTVSSTWKY